MTQFHDLDDCDRAVLLSLLVTGAISVLAGCMILLSFYLIKKIRTLTFGLIFVMTLAEVISRITYLANYNPPNTGTWQCYTQAFLIQYFISLSMYFSLAVSTHMYSLIVARKVYRMTNLLFGRAVVIALLFALVCACIPFITDQYGNIGPFCWIVLEKEDEHPSGRHVGYAMRASLMHGQIWLIYVLNSFFYIRIYKFITAITNQSRRSNEPPAPVRTEETAVHRGSFGEAIPGRSRSESKDNTVEKTVKILQYYPIILIVTWLPLIVLRVFEYASFDIPCWAFTFSLGMTNLQGICNALVFFSYDSVRQNWVEILDHARTRLMRETMTSAATTTNSSTSGHSTNVSSAFETQIMQESKLDDTL